MKKKYKRPKIDKIKIDKDISMVMMSSPPGDPGGSFRNIGFGQKFPFQK